MAGEARDLKTDTRPVKVKIENVVKKFDGRNGEMIALNGVKVELIPASIRRPSGQLGMHVSRIQTDGTGLNFSRPVQANLAAPIPRVIPDVKKLAFRIPNGIGDVCFHPAELKSNMR